MKRHTQTRRSLTQLALLAAIPSRTPVKLALDMEGGKSRTLVMRLAVLLIRQQHMSRYGELLLIMARDLTGIKQVKSLRMHLCSSPARRRSLCFTSRNTLKTERR